jgi:8-amino-7-oxononanoate synthase
MNTLARALAADLEDLRSGGLERRLRCQSSAPGPSAVLEGRPVLSLGSNNYLGLTEHLEVRAAAAEAIERWGTGSSGSRLTTGNLAIHEELEAALAAFKGAGAALLFSSGYQAALGTIPALVDRGDLVLSDALNHACLIDGCRLSRAEVRVYRHGDVDHARSLLADGKRFRRRLLVTDGVFSMDGDLAPLLELCDLCEATDTWLMVDDAHGTGVLGPTGAGTAERLGVQERVPIQMGTLSKALASEGGFIAGSNELIHTLRNRARTFIFSTAPAPASVAAARAALSIAQREPERRRRLAANAASLRSGLSNLGLAVPSGETAVVPVIVGDPGAAVKLSALLEEAGVWVPAIRPPTVPPGTARLRFSVIATHTDADLECVLAAVEQAVRSGLIQVSPGVEDPEEAA